MQEEHQIFFVKLDKFNQIFSDELIHQHQLSSLIQEEKILSSSLQQEEKKPLEPSALEKVFQDVQNKNYFSPLQQSNFLGQEKKKISNNNFLTDKFFNEVFENTQTVLENKILQKLQQPNINNNILSINVDNIDNIDNNNPNIVLEGQMQQDFSNPNVVLLEQQQLQQLQQLQQQQQQQLPIHNFSTNEHPDIILEGYNNNNNNTILATNQQQSEIQQNTYFNPKQHLESLEYNTVENHNIKKEDEEEKIEDSDLVDKIKENIKNIEDNVSSMIEKENIILEMLNADIKKNFNLIEQLKLLNTYYLKSKNIFRKTNNTKKKKKIDKNDNVIKQVKKKSSISSSSSADNNKKQKSKTNNLTFTYKNHVVYADHESGNVEQKYYYLDDNDEKVYYENKDVKKIENLLIKI